MNALPVVLILLILPAFTFGVLDPCAGRPGLGQSCDRINDCDGFGVVCISGVCRCHQDYTQKTDSDSKVNYCVKLPDTIGSFCGGNNCRRPMFCQGNKCVCVRSTIDGNRCYAASSVRDVCKSDDDCPLPFGTCSGGRCACRFGATQSGASCVAAPRCPTGARPQGACTVKATNSYILQNTPNSGNTWDSCSANSYCYTAQGSSNGVCCPATCPLGSRPETSFSCDPTATLRRCPDATHHCYRSASGSHSSTVCCRKPCRDPTPVYANGQCYSRSYLGSSCQVNEQCDGAYGMACSGGVCRCSGGFTPYSDSYTTGENPPQTCERDCGSQAKHNGECFAQSSLGQSCRVNEQCPSPGGTCFRGQCFCDCRQGYIRSATGSGCVKGQLTTRAPAGSGGATGVGGKSIGSLIPTGGSQGGSDSLLNSLKSILPIGG